MVLGAGLFAAQTNHRVSMSTANRSRFPLTSRDARKLLIEELKTMSSDRAIWQVWKDFVECAAIAIRNRVDMRQHQTREEQYKKVCSKYTGYGPHPFAKSFALLTRMFQLDVDDHLGSIFMELELGNHWNGQYFTPFEISVLNAHLVGGDLGSHLATKPFVTACDPACGSGSMIIGFVEVMNEAGYSASTKLHATCTDIDLTAVQMCYMQLSILNVPALVYHGNSLSMEMWDCWPTPTHVVGRWDGQLATAQAA
jgi:type I restriction-modification system DNA methylase subunit